MERIAKLEAQAGTTDQRLGRIEDKLDRVLERISALPTQTGLWGMIATVIGVSLAMVGCVIAVIALLGR